MTSKQVDWKTFARYMPEQGADWLGERRIGKLPSPNDVRFTIFQDGSSEATLNDQRWRHAPNSLTWEEVK